MKIKLVITGTVPSKKNSRITVRATGRSFPNQAYRKWELAAFKELAVQAKEQKLTTLTDYPVNVTCNFYVWSNHSRDIDNMLASVMDVLKTHKKKGGEVIRLGLIDDDDWQHVNPLIGQVVGIDKENPRVEIEISWAYQLTQ